MSWSFSAVVKAGDDVLTELMHAALAAGEYGAAELEQIEHGARAATALVARGHLSTGAHTVTLSGHAGDPTGTNPDNLSHTVVKVETLPPPPPDGSN